MKKIIAFLLASAPVFGGEFAITVSRTAPNVLTFHAQYKGEAVEIGLPARARLIMFQNKGENIQAAEPQGRIGLRLSDGTEFRYSLIAGSNIDFGAILDTWHPYSIDKNLTNTYTFSAVEEVAFIYPYLGRTNNLYHFSSLEQPKLVMTRFTALTEQGTPMVSLFQTHTVEAEADEIRRIYQHNLGIYGDRGFDEIVIIASRLVSEQVLHAGKKLFVLTPQRGTVPQFTRLIPEAWADAVPGMSPRMFAMFKDAALRFKPLSPPPNTQGAFVTDPLWIETSGSKEYYQSLFASGIQNAVVDVRAEALIDNNAMLRLADKHLGLDSFFAGLKAVFNPAAMIIAVSNATNTNMAAADSNKTNLLDYERINWNALFQDKIIEPFYSFFTKDAFRPDFSALLQATEKIVSRNSDYIPNLDISQSEGGIISIKWDNKRIVPMPLTSGQLTLDSARMVPKLNYIDAYYTFSEAERSERAKIMAEAASLRTATVSAFRRHLDLVSFPAPADNPYEVEEGRTVYASAAVVLSTASGSLKPAIQEAFFVFGDNGQPMLVATRLRF